MITYEDILQYLPELTHMLRKCDPLIYDCQAYISYNMNGAILTVAVCYKYSKPIGFRSLQVIGFNKYGEIFVINKAPLHILERCLLWAYGIKNERARYNERLALIKLELIEYVWHPMRSMLKVLMDT